MNQGPIWGCWRDYEWTAFRGEGPGWTVHVTPRRDGLSHHRLTIAETLTETKLREQVTQILKALP